MKKKEMIWSAIAGGAFLLAILLMFLIGRGHGPALPEATEPAREVLAPVLTEPTAPEETGTPPTPTEPMAPETMAPGELKLTAAHAFVYHTGQKRFLYIGGGLQEKLAPASLTKLLTAYTVLEHMAPETVVTVGDEVNWIDPWSSRAYIEPGHQLTVRQLVQGLMLPSGNDAAYTLAVACGRVLAEDPNLDRRMAYGLFVDEMNAQARLMGMKGTHFANPDGIDEEGHYTTMEDLVIITEKVMKNPMIMEFAATAKAEVVYTSGQTITWKNSNLLLHEDSGYYTETAMGLKTGSTDDAGACLISLFLQEDGSYLVVGVLGSTGDEERYDDTLILYNRYR